MASIGLRVSEEFEKQFDYEAQTKGLSKSDYLREIIESRHEIFFMKQTEGLVIFLSEDEKHQYDIYAQCSGLSLDLWLKKVINSLLFDETGMPIVALTDTSFFQSVENGIQVAGEQAFTKVNGSVNAPVKERLQDFSVLTAKSVNAIFLEKRDELCKNNRPVLNSTELIETILQELLQTEETKAIQEVQLLKTLLSNIELIVRCYHDREVKESIYPFKLNQLIGQLNYMLYEEIKADDVVKIESFIKALKMLL